MWQGELTVHNYFIRELLYKLLSRISPIWGTENTQKKSCIRVCTSRTLLWSNYYLTEHNDHLYENKIWDGRLRRPGKTKRSQTKGRLSTLMCQRYLLNKEDTKDEIYDTMTL